MSEASKETWRRMLRNGKIVFIGYSSPEETYFDESDPGKTMVEVFLSKRLGGGGGPSSRKVRVTVEVIDNA